MFIKNKMKCMTKSIKRGEINTNEFRVRGIDINVNELKEFVDSCETRDVNTDDKTKPYVGENNELMWPCGSIIPEFLMSYINTLKILFSITDNIKEYGIIIFRPVQDTRIRHTNTIKHVPMKFANFISSRVISVCGSPEIFEFSSSIGGVNAEASKKIKDQYAINMPFGFNAGIDISFDNTTSGVEPGRSGGFRSQPFRKNPRNRYVICIDFFNSDEILKKPDESTSRDIEELVGKIKS